MKADQKKPTAGGTDNPGGHEPATTPAQEWGERLDTGKAIARGGKEQNHIPGAEPARAPEAVKAAMPPAPPGEMPGREVRKIAAVADAIAQLGERADHAAVAAAVRAAEGIDLTVEEVAAIRAEMERQAQPPPATSST
jgi:hypothetical protein